MNTNTHKVTVGKVVQYLILILMFLLLVGPFVWELSLSFKGKGDNVYAVPPYLMPKTPTLENYIPCSSRSRYSTTCSTRWWSA